MTAKKAIIVERSHQSEKFIDAARALGADESEAHFDVTLAKVARHKTAPAASKVAPNSRKKQSI